MSEREGSRPGHRSIVNHGDNLGVISSGDYATNVVYIDNRFAGTPSLLELPVRQLDVLKPPLRRTLFGREALVGKVTDQLRSGRSVQLHGLSGVGKQAIALEANGCLGAHGLRGAVLLPQAGPADTLAAVYDRLARRIFGKEFLRGVDEELLRAAVADVDAHFTIIDCALTGADLARLQQTFPGCTFLFTSPYRTLSNDPEAVHHVQPLAPGPAAELLSAELGLPLGPVGLQNIQFEQAYRMSEGRPQRLLQYAAFIRTSDEWRARTGEAPFDGPGPVDPGQVSPQQQAEILAVALSEPARQVLVALATFGVPLHAAWFAAVTGHPHATSCGPELYDRRLVTLHGDGAEYRITADALAAVQSQRWPPVPPATAAEGILALLANATVPGPALPLPDPQLLLAVANGLDAAGKRAQASRFVRATIPLALRAGHRRAALQLYAVGQMAASQAGLTEDVDFYLRTGEQTRKLLNGDAIAAAAALAFLTSSAGQAAVTAVTGAGQSASAGQIGRHVARIGRKLLQLAQAKPAVAAVTAIAVAGGATTVAVVAANGPSIPAGCSTAYRAASHQSDNVRTPQDLAAYYRTSARALSAAAAEATDSQVKSVIQARADDLNNQADVQERAGNRLANSSVSLDNAHPDVVAALASGDVVLSDGETLKALLPVCPQG
ncbi:hypothetical protein ACFYST_19790 [Kitasatospora sp. NPDC004614]|uniref:hypothetical protein n=1 Tax=unclassified Kitasatospora TaxID=2633591 RepID=UPI0036D1C971